MYNPLVKKGFDKVGITTETDPLFTASEAANFVAGDKDKLDGAVQKSGDTMSGPLVIGSPEVEVDGRYLFQVGSDEFSIISNDMFNDVASRVPQFVARRARGTHDAPIVIKRNDRLGSFTFIGHDGEKFGTLASSALIVYAAEDFSPTAKGSYFAYETTPKGSATRVPSSKMDENGINVMNNSMMFGDEGVAGSWRFKKEGNNLAAQRFENGEWVTKGAFTP